MGRMGGGSTYPLVTSFLRNYLNITIWCSLLGIAGCGEIKDEPAPVASSIPNVTVENIGRFHNKIAVDYLNYHYDHGKALKVDDVKNYMLAKYGVNISHSPSFLFGSRYVKPNQSLKKAVANFDPFLFLERHRDGLGNHFYEQSYALLSYTKSLYKNPRRLLEVVDSLKKVTTVSGQLLAGEREKFLIMLNVCRSSVKLWTYVKENNILLPAQGMFTTGVPRDQLWKVPACDWVGGIFGSLGGPAGALGGFFGSSIMAGIGLWGEGIYAPIEHPQPRVPLHPTDELPMNGEFSPGTVVNNGIGWDEDFPSDEMIR